MTDSNDQMTDGPWWWWCRFRPKDLPAGAYFGIVGTALFCFSTGTWMEGLVGAWGLGLGAWSLKLELGGRWKNINITSNFIWEPHELKYAGVC
jgi:hypothetical protein